MNETYELSLDGEVEPLRVIAYRAVEQIDEPYRAEVRCDVADAGAFAAKALGRAATLSTNAPDATVRRLQGVVSASFVDGAATDAHPAVLVIEARLARLRWRKRRRIFQDVTSLDVATQLLAEHAAPMRALVQRELPRRPYCVQLDESDLDFVKRLLADDGLYFFFEQDDAVVRRGEPIPTEHVVVVDQASSHPRTTPVDKLRHQRADLHARAEGIVDPRLERRVATEAVHLAGLDFKHPRSAPTDAASTPPTGLATDAALERRTHELSYETVPAKPGPASIELEQERRDVLRLEGALHAPHLAVGHVFSLVEAIEPQMCADWVVVALSHGGKSVAGGEHTYEARFVAVPATTPYRPERKPKPTCHGVETATVVGPEGEEVHTDEHGRVRVRFPWDESEPPGDTATTWLRVAQGWAGTGFGMQFLPRVGSEVLVAFVGGDADRPIVVGGLYDATRPYPQALPSSKTVSTVRTQSVGGAGSSELTFEDLAGAEVVTLRGQRNLWLGSGADCFVDAGGSQTVTIAGKADTRVGADQATTVGGAHKLTVAGPTTEETATASVIRHGNQVDVVDGCEFRTVGESVEVRVGGGYQLTVGTAGLAFANFTIQGTGSFRAQKTLMIGSDQAVQIVVGGSSIVLAPDKISLRSPEIELTSPKIALLGEGAAEFIEVGQGIRVKSQVVEVHGAAAALTLDAEAKVEAPAIKLGGTPKAPTATDSESSETGTVTFKLQNIDPAKSTTALVRMPNGEVKEHAVPSSGVLTLDGKPGERFSLIDVRVDGTSVTKTRA